MARPKFGDPGFLPNLYIAFPDYLSEDIAAGLDLTAKDVLGDTLLERICAAAIVFESASIARCLTLLLDAGADVNARGEGMIKGMTPLMQLASSYKREGEKQPHLEDDVLDLFDLLIERGADIEAKTDQGKTALDCGQGKIRAYLEAWLLEGGNPRKRAKVKRPRGIHDI